MEWDQVISDHNIFLSRSYLKAVEEAPPKGMAMVYLLFFQNNIPIGVAYCQLLKVRVVDSVSGENLPENASIFQKWWYYLKRWLVSPIHFRLMICGNAMVTGEHGFYFLPAIEPEQCRQLLGESLDQLAQNLDQKNYKSHIIIVKDIFPKNIAYGVEKPFNKAQFQPHMELDIRPEWNSITEYLGAMTSKYRKRMKKALKRGKDLYIQELDVAAIEVLLPQMNQLYKKIAERAAFNAVLLAPNYFLSLKKNLGDRMEVLGYYLKGELIGFCTLIDNHLEYDAHFLGYLPEINKEYDLYLNMLLEMIRRTIARKKPKITFARTAMEIKSSVGAIPYDLSVYARHRNPLINSLLPIAVNAMEPKVGWKQRHPFKVSS